MKKSLFAIGFVVVTVGCSTINVNIGDEAIRRASKCSTNAVVSATNVCTNGSETVVGSASILVNINMNAAKDIKPDSNLSLTPQ